jgi:hypothetical protein
VFVEVNEGVLDGVCVLVTVAVDVALAVDVLVGDD